RGVVAQGGGFGPDMVKGGERAGGLVQGLHRDVRSGLGDAGTRRLLDELLAYPGVPRHWRRLDLDASTDPFLPIEFRRGDVELRYFSMLTNLGTPHDITLQEIRIESFYPADSATEDAARRLAARRPRGPPPPPPCPRATTSVRPLGACPEAPLLVRSRSAGGVAPARS